MYMSPDRGFEFRTLSGLVKSLHKIDLHSFILNIIITRKGNPELLGPALDCMSAIDKKSAYIFCKYNCIDLPHGQDS